MTLEQVKRKFTDCGGPERMAEMILETPKRLAASAGFS